MTTIEDMAVSHGRKKIVEQYNDDREKAKAAAATQSRVPEVLRGAQPQSRVEKVTLPQGAGIRGVTGEFTEQEESSK